MQQSWVDDSLWAWGAFKRREAAQLKIARFAQSKYGQCETLTTDFDYRFDDEGERVGVPLGDGHYRWVEYAMVAIVQKVVHSMRGDTGDWLQAHFVVRGSVDSKAARIGVSVTTWRRRVREAKVSFELMYRLVQRGVVQRGVPICDGNAMFVNG